MAEIVDFMSYLWRRSGFHHPAAMRAESWDKLQPDAEPDQFAVDEAKPRANRATLAIALGGLIAGACDLTYAIAFESVAESVGFKSSDAFRRAFERRVGVTPTAFRRQAQREKVGLPSPHSIRDARRYLKSHPSQLGRAA